jgi:hypothetical protein
VVAVIADETFFFLQDLLNEFLMVLAKSLRVSPILCGHLFVAYSLLLHLSKRL